MICTAILFLYSSKLIIATAHNIDPSIEVHYHCMACVAMNISLWLICAPVTPVRAMYSHRTQCEDYRIFTYFMLIFQFNEDFYSSGGWANKLIRSEVVIWSQMNYVAASWSFKLECTIASQREARWYLPMRISWSCVSFIQESRGDVYIVLFFFFQKYFRL